MAQFNTEAQSGFTHINFGGEFPNQVFSVAVPRSMHDLIEKQIWRGGKIRVKGIVQLDPRGTPRIVLSEPGQLFLVLTAKPQH